MRVKSASFVFALMCGFFFAGCLSNTAGSAVFSTTDQVSDGNYVISTDEFEGTNTAMWKQYYVDYVNGMDTLHISPYFIYKEGVARYFLTIQYNYYDKPRSLSKIVLLGDTGRVVIGINGTPSTDYEYDSKSVILQHHSKTTVSETISEDDFLKLVQFFEKNSMTRLGLYMANNKAIELKENKDFNPHAVFAEAYSFYQKNIKGKEMLPIERSSVTFN
mgnify:CR=1 FL=1